MTQLRQAYIVGLYAPRKNTSLNSVADLRIVRRELYQVVWR